MWKNAAFQRIADEPNQAIFTNTVTKTGIETAIKIITAPAKYREMKRSVLLMPKL